MELDFLGKSPIISEGAYIAPSAVLIGDIEIQRDVSIWFNTVIRADNDKVFIGEGSNIQDLTLIHVDKNIPVYIGKNVTVGHKCIIHGAKIGDNTLIGMGSILMDKVEVGENTIIGAGTLIPAGKKIPSGVLVMGSPGKVIRDLTSEEVQSITASAKNYTEHSKKYIK